MKGFVAATFLRQVVCARHIHDVDFFTAQETQALSLVQMRMDYDNLQDGKTCTEWNLCNAKVTSDFGIIDSEDVELLHTSAIRYHEVGHVFKMPVDLLLTTNDKYVAHDIVRNGRIGCFGSINIKAPGSVRINFTFVESGTNIPLHGEYFRAQNFTIVDFGRATTEGEMVEKVEQVVAKGFTNINNTRTLAISGPDSDGRYTFAADPKNVPLLDVEDMFVDNFAPEDLAGTVNLAYNSTNTWEVEFKAVSDANGPGRTFLWAGRTETCSVPLECTCTNNPAMKDPMNMPWNLCDSEFEKNSNGQLLRYKRVALLRDGVSYADLVVTNLTEFQTHAEDMNGKKRCMGRLNVLAQSNVTMQFAMVKEGTDERIPVNRAHPMSWEMSIFDFDESLYGMKEIVGLRNYSQVYAPFLKKRRDSDGTLYVENKMVKSKLMDGSDLSKMTTNQIQSSLSMSYFQTSEWTINFATHQPDRNVSWPGGRNFFFGGTSCASRGSHQCKCPLAQTAEPPLICK